jgi:hypothetical protein
VLRSSEYRHLSPRFATVGSAIGVDPIEFLECAFARPFSALSVCRFEVSAEPLEGAFDPQVAVKILLQVAVKILLRCHRCLEDRSLLVLEIPYLGFDLGGIVDDGHVLGGRCLCHGCNYTASFGVCQPYIGNFLRYF